VIASFDLIAIIALIISGIALGWNIYRDVIQKPKFEIITAIYNTIDGLGKTSKEQHISLRALNHGPGKNRVVTVALASRTSFHFVRRKKYKKMAVMPWATHHPMCNEAARTSRLVEPGEEVVFAFPFDKECCLSEDYQILGICDVFGRYSWCSKKDLNEMKSRYKKTFS